MAQAIGHVFGTVTLNGEGVPQARGRGRLGSFKATTYADEHGEYSPRRRPGGARGRDRDPQRRRPRGHRLGDTRRGGQGPADRRLAPGHRRLYGYVRAAGGGVAPFSVVTVEVGGQGGGKQQATTRPEDGFYDFPQMPAGLATVTVDTVASIDRAEAKVEVLARGEVQQDIELNGVGAIEGSVVGVPAGYDTRVTVTGTGSFKYSLGAVPDPQPNGTFLLPEILAGPFTATLSTSRGPLRLAGRPLGEVRPGETTVVTLEVQPTGRLEGCHAPRRQGGVRRRRHREDPQWQPAGDGGGGRLVPCRRRGGGRAGDGLDHRPRSPAAWGSGAGVVPEGGTLTLDPIQLDDTPIAVLSVEPADGAPGLALDAPVRLVFSDPLDARHGAPGTVHVRRGRAIRSLSPRSKATRRSYSGPTGPGPTRWSSSSPSRPGWPTSSAAGCSRPSRAASAPSTSRRRRWWRWTPRTSPSRWAPPPSCG